MADDFGWYDLISDRLHSVKAKFAVGDRIRHPTFGVGVVGKLVENKVAGSSSTIETSQGS